MSRLPVTLRYPMCRTILTMAVFLAAAAPLQSQQVRTVADDTAIRLDPDPESPVIATLPAGTDLNWVGESGVWYTVSFTGPGGEDLLGYVLSGEVQVLGEPPSSATPPPGASGPLLPGGIPPSGGQLSAIPDVELQYENERNRRSSGLKKIIWGIALIGASRAALDMIPALQVPEPEDYATADEYQSALDRRDNAETGRSVVSGLGGALIGWGAIEFGWGWRRMSILEVDLPRQGEAPLEQQYAEANERRMSGRSKFFWGVFLIGSSYAAVEYIPALGVPDPEEYDDPDEYESALDRRDRVETIQQWTMLGAGALGAWGGVQWVRGARRMTQIEATARMASLDVPWASRDSGLTPELFVGRDRGGRTNVGLQWTW